MINGLILDVDGVMIGSRQGYNWPSPHPDIIRTLRTLRSNGMAVCLCTGKGSFAIRDIVMEAHLDNVHIGDGGAVVRDFIHGKIIQQHTLDKEMVRDMTALLLGHGIYVELYTADSYYVQKDTICDKTTKHTAILSREPSIVRALSEVAGSEDVIKIMPIADNEAGKQAITDLFRPHRDNLTLQWGMHPTAAPYAFGLITDKGISKRQASDVISRHTGVPLAEMLGVGDGMTDWLFMDVCGYAGAMGNGPKQLKDNVRTKGVNGYTGGHVDENGLLDILRNFRVIE